MLVVLPLTFRSVPAGFVACCTLKPLRCWINTMYVHADVKSYRLIIRLYAHLLGGCWRHCSMLHNWLHLPIMWNALCTVTKWYYNHCINDTNRQSKSHHNTLHSLTIIWENPENCLPTTIWLGKNPSGVNRKAAIIQNGLRGDNRTQKTGATDNAFIFKL